MSAPESTKAEAVKIVPSEGYVKCPLTEATHVAIRFPGPSDLLVLPMILRGTRDGTNCWTWNGDSKAPTIKPSILTTHHAWKCHTWVNDGKAQFLDDTTHDLRGQTLDMLEVGELVPHFKEESP